MSARDTSTFLIAILTATLAGVTVHVWRLGNEKRDVALLGVFCDLCGAGTAVAAPLTCDLGALPKDDRENGVREA